MASMWGSMVPPDTSLTRSAPPPTASLATRLEKVSTEMGTPLKLSSSFSLLRSNFHLCQGYLQALQRSPSVHQIDVTIPVVSELF